MFRCTADVSALFRCDCSVSKQVTQISVQLLSTVAGQMEGGGLEPNIRLVGIAGKQPLGGGYNNPVLLMHQNGVYCVQLQPQPLTRACTHDAGKLPFWGGTSANVSPLMVMQEILGGDISFAGEEWAGVSVEAADFVGRLLDRDYNSRMTAEQALQHPWIAGMLCSGHEGARPLLDLITYLTALDMKSMHR